MLNNRFSLLLDDIKEKKIINNSTTEEGKLNIKNNPFLNKDTTKLKRENKENREHRENREKKEYKNKEKSKNLFIKEKENTYIQKQSHDNKKEEINVNKENFPELSSSISINTKDKQNTNNWKNIVKEKDKIRKIETNESNSEPLPGWVKMKLNKKNREKKVIFNYGEQTEWQKNAYKREQIEEKKQQFKMILKEQEKRDEMNIMYGEDSPYWGMKSLLEFSDSESSSLNEDRDSNHSIMSDKDSIYSYSE